MTSPKKPSPGPKKLDTPRTDAQRASADWNPVWDTLAEWDARFLEGYLAFRSAPRENGPLPKKVKELIMIAINASATHLYAPGVRRHIQNALNEGATPAEILEAIELTTVVGIHACNVGVPILVEELRKHDERRPTAAPTSSKRRPAKRK